MAGSRFGRRVGGRRSGVVTRGELRGREPAPRRDGLALVTLATLGALVVVVLGSALASPAPLDPVVDPDGSPPPTLIAGVTLSPDPTAAPSPPSTPSPSPSPAPTPTPTPSPPPTPTPSPTPSPSPTASPSPSPTPIAAPTAPLRGLLIVEPVDRSVVVESAIVVRGLAPPRARITRDIRFWFDQHTTADAGGRWSMAVELLAGENVLTFRVGDQMDTQRTLIVYYEPPKEDEDAP